MPYCKQLSHMIFSFSNDKVPLAPKYSGVSSLEVLCPSIFLIRFFNRMLHPFIFLIRFSDRIKPLSSVYKLAFQILINTYELDFVASTSFTIYTSQMKHPFVFNLFIAMMNQSSNQQSIYMNYQQAKQNGEQGRKVRERQSNGLRESERMGIGQKWFQQRSEIIISEMEHLSIFNNVSHQDKQLSIKIRICPKFFD